MSALLLVVVLAAPPDAPPGATASATAPVAASPVDRLVRHTADGASIIDRTAALALFADPRPLAGQVWLALPHAEAIKAAARGEKVAVPDTVGLEIRGVKPGTAVYRLGLRTGDIVQRVDGTPVTALPVALAVGWRLRSRLAGEPGWGFTVELLRAGRPVGLAYRIEDSAAAGAPSAVPSTPVTAAPEE